MPSNATFVASQNAVTIKWTEPSCKYGFLFYCVIIYNGVTTPIIQNQTTQNFIEFKGLQSNTTYFTEIFSSRTDNCSVLDNEAKIINGSFRTPPHIS